MDEYIKREDALDAVLFALVGTGYQSTAILAIRDIPTADVAPKSEVAREMFEEIEEKLNYNHTIFSNCASRLVRNDYLDGRLEAYKEFIDIITELKKKYTEDQT